MKLNPPSAIARIEYANGLVMLEGKKSLKEAEKLYGDAAACEAARCDGEARHRAGQGGAGGLETPRAGSGYWSGVLSRSPKGSAMTSMPSSSSESASSLEATPRMERLGASS